jgi:adenylylsulfate kinase-like enzyme
MSLRPGRLPVLWLCGPPGVGKSTASWQLYTELAGAGVHVAFADSDQLCMCYPAPPADPGRLHVKALNTGALVASFREAGAQCVVVNGVLGPAGLEGELLPGADVTICRLRARRDEIHRRFTARHQQLDDRDRMLREIDDEIRVMDESSFADACVDTTDVPPGELTARVRSACPDWPGFTPGFTPGLTRGFTPGFAGDPPDVASRSPVRHYPPVGGRVVLITGPAGVGKSTIGFRFYMNCLNAGRTAGYADLRQIGFLSPADENDPGNRRLRARNLAAIWRNYQAAGATHLVATGPIGNRDEFRLYAEELTGADLTLVRLRAGRDELLRRVMTRGAGGSWPEPGDQLRDQPAEYLASVARQAAAAAADTADTEDAAGAEANDRSGPDGLVIDTTGRSAEESAALIAAAVGWLYPGSASVTG